MPVEFGDSKCGLVRTAIEKIHPPIRVLEHIGVDAASFVWAHEGPLAGDGIAGGEGAFVFGGSIIELSVDYGYGGGIDLQGEAGGLDEMPVEEVGGPPIAHLFRGKKPVFVVIQNYQWIGGFAAGRAGGLEIIGEVEGVAKSLLGLGAHGGEHQDEEACLGRKKATEIRCNRFKHELR